ncbi:MAG: CHAT domain-containing protein, partial [Bacteroidota bacterium]
ISYYEHTSEKAHLLRALETFTLADQLVDIIRFESTTFQSKLFWREQSASLYMKAVKTCYRLGKPEEAFHFLEKNKALLLLEDLTQEKAKEHAQLPFSLSEREFVLRRDIHLAEEALTGSAPNPSLTDSLREVVYDSKRTYEQFIDSLETSFPSYHAYKRSLPLLSFDTAQAILQRDNSSLVHYLLDDEEGYGIFMNAQRQHFFQLPNVPEVHQLITALRTALSRPFYSVEDRESYHELAHKLYTRLFPEDILLTETKKLTVIPDHRLHQVPFETLVSAPGSDDYLVRQLEINYAYSLSFRAENEKRRRSPANRFIGFAPIRFADTTLTDLSRSREEVAQISDWFAGDRRYEDQANKENFMRSAKDYHMLHLSTHANAGTSSPWIAFRADKLSLEELYATPNEADLVVLSACNTSVGELKVGEGVMSLARGFMRSGARSVVSTLWSANEKSTNTILIDFYSHLKEGETKSAALHHAKQSYLENHSGVEASPYYWAAPVLIGNTDVLKVRPAPKWISPYLFLLLVSFVVGLIFLVKRMRHHH